MADTERLDLNEIRQAISNAGLRCEAGENEVNKKTRIERSMLLGFVPGPNDLSIKEKEDAAKANLASFLAYGAEAAYPASYDLRNVGGQNFITSVKSRGGCGSCVEFGTMATVEGAFRRQGGNVL